MLAQLKLPERTLIIRGYIHYHGSAATTNKAPEKAEQYIKGDNVLDIVVCYRWPVFNESFWTDGIKKIIRRYGPILYSVQITEEPNLKSAFAGDRSFKDVERALLTGVQVAKEKILRCALPVKVGFYSILSFGPADKFWDTVGDESFSDFRKGINYVGLDFFPDVFRRVAACSESNDLEQSIINMLRNFRNEWLAKNGIPASVTIPISETGWPTGPGRSYEKQSKTIVKIIRDVYSLKDELNITQYELFSLRDSDSDIPDLFYQFGLLKDDYSRSRHL